MKKLSIVEVASYNAATTHNATNGQFTEFLAKTTKVINVGDGSIISVRNKAGHVRHTLPIMISAENERNTYHRNIFFLDTFGLKDNEADFMYTATLLTAIYEDPTINECFNGVNRLASGLYVQWLANTYIRQYGLDVSESDNIKVVTALYWCSMGRYLNDDIKGDDAFKLIRQVADASGVPEKDVKVIIDKYELLDANDETKRVDFTWYMWAMKAVSEILGYRMNGVSAMSAISNSWYRGMAIQSQMAMNYKPFFIAMLYTAFNDRSAARTGIDTLIKNTLEGRRRQQAETFVGTIESIIKAQLS